jgi:hypothetical protein
LSHRSEKQIPSQVDFEEGQVGIIYDKQMEDLMLLEDLKHQGCTYRFHMMVQVVYEIFLWWDYYIELEICDMAPCDIWT